MNSTPEISKEKFNESITNELSVLIDGGEEAVEEYLKDKTLGERKGLITILCTTYEQLRKLKDDLKSHYFSVGVNSDSLAELKNSISKVIVEMMKIEIIICHLNKTVKDIQSDSSDRL